MLKNKLIKMHVSKLSQYLRTSSVSKSRTLNAGPRSLNARSIPKNNNNQVRRKKVRSRLEIPWSFSSWN